MKALLIIAVIFSLYSCGPAYRSAPEEALQVALSDDYLISPEEAGTLSGDPAYQFVDLRSPAEFARGHIDGAVNLPTLDLLDPAGKKRLKDPAKTFILYGDTELAVNGPWLLLRQLGYANVKVLQGGYVYWSAWEQDGRYQTETAEYRYDSLFTLATQRTRMEEEALRAKPLVVGQAPAAQKEIVPVKKKVEKEEEEGC